MQSNALGHVVLVVVCIVITALLVAALLHLAVARFDGNPAIPEEAMYG